MFRDCDDKGDSTRYAYGVLLTNQNHLTIWKNEYGVALIGASEDVIATSTMTAEFDLDLTQ